MSTGPLTVEPAIARMLSEGTFSPSDEALIHFLCFAPPLLLLLIGLTNPDLDQNVFLVLNEKAAWLPDNVWAVLSLLGGGGCLYALALPFMQREPRYAAALLLLVVAIGVGINLFKDLVDTQRPPEVLDPSLLRVIGPTYYHYAFPSGHTTSVFAVAAVLMRRLEYRLLPSLLLLGFAGAIGLSRIAVGVHWPIDVAAGIALGTLMGWAAITLTHRFRFFAHPAWRFAALALGVLVIVPLVIDPGRFSGYAGAREVRYALAAIVAYSVLNAFVGRLPASVPGASRVQALLSEPGPGLLRLVRFGLIGLNGFIVDLSVYAMLFLTLGMPPEVARGAAYWTAATCNWFFNRTFTFSDRRQSAHLTQWTKYLAMCAVSFIPNFATFWILIHWVPVFAAHTVLALIAGVMAGMIFNFVIASRWIFPRVLQTESET